MRRTLALDTDAGGRRLGISLENDHDGILSDKDILPVYDGAGGPPKYFELDGPGPGRMGIDSGGYEGVGAGLGTRLAPPTNYPDAPPGGPAPTNPNDHPLPSPALDSETGTNDPSSSSVPIPVHSEFAVDSASPHSPPTQHDASLPLPPR